MATKQDVEKAIYGKEPVYAGYGSKWEIIEFENCVYVKLLPEWNHDGDLFTVQIFSIDDDSITYVMGNLNNKFYPRGKHETVSIDEFVDIAKEYGMY